MFVVRFTSAPGTDGVRALRGLLKVVLRRFGLRCISAQDGHDAAGHRAIRSRWRRDKGEMKMAFGKRRGGDLQPLLKWDGRVGRFYTQDRVDGQAVQNDVTDNFAAVFDLERLEHGWLHFPRGAAPETKLFPATAEDIGPPPGEDWREGVRLEAKLEGDEEWRELLSSAFGLWNGLDGLHTEFIGIAKDHPGEVPIVQLNDVHEIQTSNGKIYEPVFTIVDWIDRDAMPPPRPRQKPQPKPRPQPAAKKRADMDDDHFDREGEHA